MTSPDIQKYVVKCFPDQILESIL
jgi:hypothetical protein